MATMAVPQLSSGLNMAHLLEVAISYLGESCVMRVTDKEHSVINQYLLIGYDILAVAGPAFGWSM